MPEIVADSPSLTCYHLFPNQESKDLSSLVLISLCLAGAHARALCQGKPCWMNFSESRE
jgi:hypothetical protein